MLVKDQSFTGERVVLDGSEFEGCRFTRCKLIFLGQEETALRDNTLEDCDFALEGAASLTMRFLLGLAETSDDFLVALLRSLQLNPARLGRLAAS